MYARFSHGAAPSGLLGPGGKLDFDDAGIGLEYDLPDRALKSDFFLSGRESRLFNTGRLQPVKPIDDDPIQAV
jgi:hypothetical protein